MGEVKDVRVGWWRRLSQGEKCYFSVQTGVGGAGDFSSLFRDQTGSWVHSASYKMSTGSLLQGVRRPSVALTTLPFPNALAVYMRTLASTSPMGLHGL